MAALAGSLEQKMQVVRDAVPATAGRVAGYIPRLAEADPNTFGAAICSVNGDFHSAGDDRHRFSIQSCVKPFTYLMACEDLGLRTVHDYVGREPSGQAFNAFELTADKPPLPFNPMINTGAIAICNLLGQRQGSRDEIFGGIENRLRSIATDDGLAPMDLHYGFDSEVYESECLTGFTNYALAHFLRDKSDVTLPHTPAICPSTVDENLQLYDTKPLACQPLARDT